METGSPPVTRIVTMVLFALSCVGLLLFLWLSFGGNLPFNPQGYRIRISFQNAGELATQADVRIAGVSVGTVVSKQLDPQGNRTIATIQIQNKYAPIHQNATAILREKTILGETYVQLTPGSPNSPIIRDDGLLARGQVQHAVQLSEIFDAFDPTTRHAFQVWQQEMATALKGNDQNLNDVLGNLPTFAADATDILQVLDIQHNAVVNLVRNGGTVFDALSANQAALRNVITSGDSVFSEIAANNASVAAIFHVFPTFLTETRLTMTRLKQFSTDTDPLLKELMPVAQNLKPTLDSVQQLSPYLQQLFIKLGPLITVSKTGLPAISQVLDGASPLLGALGPFLEQLNPIFVWLSGHQQLVSDFISDGAAGLAATTDSFGGNGIGHYLRQFGPTGAETASLAPTRDSANRGNTYPPSLWLSEIFDAGQHNGAAGGNDWGLPSWDCNNTGKGAVPSHDAAIGGTPACWVQHPAGSLGGKIPEITPAAYSNK
jgi:phospholipid/cholesterol/gamma-HCH transport system substrate-binding protein